MTLAVVSNNPSPLKGDKVALEAQKLGARDDRERLKTYITDLCLMRGEITLSNGQKSDFYFNMKPLMMNKIALKLAAYALNRHIPKTCDYIGGLEIGAVPLTAALLALDDTHAFQGFFIRKQPKPHGLRKSIEGIRDDEDLVGKSITIIEDVTTSGQSALKSIAILRAQGAIVEKTISLLDREQGARQNMAKENIELISCFTAQEILSKAP